MSASSTTSLLNNLMSFFEEWKHGTGKNISIIRSSSAVVSTASSFLLIWIIFRSRNRLTTTYHRMLLGMSSADMLISLSVITFSAVAPKELSYFIWNARGNQATCSASGFINVLGAYSSVLYSCTLNLYYLAKIKYNKPDSFIAKKVEPWLHAVPISYGLIFGTIFVATHGMNATIGGVCGPYGNHNPPHCAGYEDGEIPEGFEIPCGRGQSSERLRGVTNLITTFLPPIAIGISLGMIYRSVLKQEQKIARYGVGNQDSSQSRAVLYRAVAYSVAYFLTWIWGIIFTSSSLAGAWPTEFPPPKWVIVFNSVLVFFTPLQGLWTLLIYLHPKVMNMKKRSSDGNISWFRAFSDALWLAVTGGKKSPMTRKSKVAPTPGTEQTKASTTTAAGPTIYQVNCTHAESVVIDVKEVKSETQESEPTQTQSTLNAMV